ncbi:hypothetical protein MP228_012803 [Amoeboaphelidium protococcarum]|nr:hypothetical protein MP228_012803 [Amoeboaphelidium protococcarum]
MIQRQYIDWSQQCALLPVDPINFEVALHWLCLGCICGMAQLIDASHEILWCLMCRISSLSFAAVGLLSEYDIVGHHVHPIPQHPIVSDNGYFLTSSVLLMNHGQCWLARLTEWAPVNAPRCLSLFFNLLLIGVHVRRLTSGRCYSFREYKSEIVHG